MSAFTRTVTLDGLAGRLIEVEVDIANGLPKTILVGLPDAMITEARDRCRSAVANCGGQWPNQRVTINLAPSAIPKSGSHYDLAIAVAVMCAQGKIAPDAIANMVFLGELALDGRLRALSGVLPATLAALEGGVRTIIVPEVNQAEAELVAGMTVIGVRSLKHIIAVLNGCVEPDEPPVDPLEIDSAPWAGLGAVPNYDMSDVVGQDDARLSILVAAAGGHHVLLTGPPGIGKTMLAQRLPGLLPDLAPEESIAASAVHSVAGVLSPSAPLLCRPPFIDPHHTASAAAIVGGGSRHIRPGAMSLAHRGVLFLDEAPEFASNVLDALRQPLESGRIIVSRAHQTIVYPALFQLVLAANPCPCGYWGSVSQQCECSPLVQRRYADRISGPIRDRMDIVRSLSPQLHGTSQMSLEPRASTEVLAKIVADARARQAERYRECPWSLNTAVPATQLRTTWPLSSRGIDLIDQQVGAHQLNDRSVDRIVRIAWTIADICAHDVPQVSDVRAAIGLRHSGPVPAELLELVQ